MWNRSKKSPAGKIEAGIATILVIVCAVGLAKIAVSAKESARTKNLAKIQGKTPVQEAKNEAKNGKLSQARLVVREPGEMPLIEQPEPQYKNARCINGILFATVKGELSNVGYCKKD